MVRQQGAMPSAVGVVGDLNRSAKPSFVSGKPPFVHEFNVFGGPNPDGAAADCSLSVALTNSNRICRKQTGAIPFGLRSPLPIPQRYSLLPFDDIACVTDFRFSSMKRIAERGNLYHLTFVGV
jgi:hypothetical protein